MASRSEIKKNGLFDIIDFLYYDLILFLQEENRYTAGGYIWRYVDDR